MDEWRDAVVTWYVPCCSYANVFTVETSWSIIRCHKQSLCPFISKLATPYSELFVCKVRILSTEY